MILDQLLEAFAATFITARSSVKDRQNARQAARHVRVFLEYMWGAETPPPTHMFYLTHVQKITEYVFLFVSWLMKLRTFHVYFETDEGRTWITASVTHQFIGVFHFQVDH